MQQTKHKIATDFFSAPPAVVVQSSPNGVSGMENPTYFQTVYQPTNQAI